MTRVDAGTNQAGKPRPGSALGAVIAVYLLARIISLDILLLAERQLRGTSVSGPRFRLWHDALFRWDVGFYHGIAADGYQSELPLDDAGGVVGNKWAFFPVFPLAARLTRAATGLPFEFAAVLINVIAGAVAAVCLFKLVSRFADTTAALRAVALWSFFPTAFVLQVPYAEAIWSMFAIGFLLALVDRRDGVAAVLLIAASLSRGAAVPLSAAGLWHVWRERAARRPSSLLLAASAVVAPFLWVGVAAGVTGRLDAYAATQRAWGYAPDLTHMVSRWLDLAGRLDTEPFSMLIVLVLFAVAGLTIVTVRSPMPVELKVFAGFAAVFLFLVAQPGAVAFTSAPRFAFGILTIPIALALLTSRRPIVAAMLGLFVLLQYWWVFNIWSGRIGIAP